MLAGATPAVAEMERMWSIVWSDLFFRFPGRISRTQWWIGVVIVVVVGSVNGWVNRAVMPDDGITTVGQALIQTTPVADHFQADVVAVEFRNLLLERVHEQFHQERDFLFRPAPVLA